MSKILNSFIEKMNILTQNTSFLCEIIGISSVKTAKTTHYCIHKLPYFRNKEVIFILINPLNVIQTNNITKSVT